MPIYEYRCKKCGHAFDHLARTLADTASRCPKCGARNPAKQLSNFTATVSEGKGTSSCPTGTCPTGTCSL
jgi:putative FmdB family regulatory protein